MSHFSVTILGSNSSIPTKDRGLTSQIVSLENQLYMIDCGEGTQFQLSKFNIKRNKINAVFISHLHGDHVYGLPGFVTSYSHFERKNPLNIYGPVGIKKYLETTFEVSQAFFSFPIQIYECDVTTSRVIYEDSYCTVSNFPLSHRIPTQGFIITEKSNPYRIDELKIKDYELSIDQIKQIKSGNSIQVANQMYPPEYFCKPKISARKYVFASDTAPISDFPSEINHADLLYHEATYLHDLKELAIERGHSTSLQAALFAQKIGAKRLILGHYSSRYHDLISFQKEAQEVFLNTELAQDGITFVL